MLALEGKLKHQTLPSDTSISSSLSLTMCMCFKGQNIVLVSQQWADVIPLLYSTRQRPPPSPPQHGPQSTVQNTPQQMDLNGLRAFYFSEGHLLTIIRILQSFFKINNAKLFQHYLCLNLNQTVHSFRHVITQIRSFQTKSFIMLLKCRVSKCLFCLLFGQCILFGIRVCTQVL